MRAFVLDRDGWICQLCFGPIDPHARAGTGDVGTADHIVCVADGGRWWDPANLRAAHVACNRSRANVTRHRRGRSYPDVEPW